MTKQKSTLQKMTDASIIAMIIALCCIPAHIPEKGGWFTFIILWSIWYYTDEVMKLSGIREYPRIFIQLAVGFMAYQTSTAIIQDSYSQYSNAEATNISISVIVLFLVIISFVFELFSVNNDEVEVKKAKKVSELNFEVILKADFVRAKDDHKKDTVEYSLTFSEDPGFGSGGFFLLPEDQEGCVPIAIEKEFKWSTKDGMLTKKHFIKKSYYNVNYDRDFIHKSLLKGGWIVVTKDKK